MLYKQVKSFNQNKAGSKPGWCLQNTRLGYGIKSLHARAIQAWEALPADQKHKDKNVPKGVSTPLFYDYYLRGESYGHVNVMLPNGNVWSDGKVYVSLSAFLRSHSNVKYLGWGESLNGVRVIKEVPPKKHIETVKKWTWNVRTKSVNGRRIGILKGGQRVETQVLKNGWRKINFKGKTGYVSPFAWRKK